MDHNGVINELIQGTWRHPITQKQAAVDIKNILIADTLEGREGGLLKPYHGGKKLAIVSDERTREVLGQRIYKQLKAEHFNVSELVWKNPVASEAGVEELRNLTAGFDDLIAVGSGTVSDSVKLATFLDKKTFSVFPTSPQGAYTTSTASISYDGFKKSLTTHSAQGVFNDISIISKCPKRLIRSAFADVICRTTAQVDWYLSHLLFHTNYEDTPYILLAYDEAALLDNAAKLFTGNEEVFGMLLRVCSIMGMGTGFTRTTHSGSMAEHMISHYIDMFAGEAHPGTLHGEQVGVSTLAMSKLQTAIFQRKSPPKLMPTRIVKAELFARYGETIGANCFEQLRAKSLDHKQADALNRRLENEWTTITEKLTPLILPTAKIENAFNLLGAYQTGIELGLTSEFFRKAVLYAREIRDRFTTLDLAGDAGLLEDFVKTCT